MLAPPSLNLPPKEDAIFALGRFVCQSALGPNPCRAELEAFRPAGLRAVDPEGRLVRGLLLALAPADARAQGFEGADFALRYFSPWNGIEEDPATGSAQCMAAPYWARRLGKCRLRGEQRPNPPPPARTANYDLHLTNYSAAVLPGPRRRVRGGAGRAADRAAGRAPNCSTPDCSSSAPDRRAEHGTAAAAAVRPRRHRAGRLAAGRRLIVTLHYYSPFSVWLETEQSHSEPALPHALFGRRTKVWRKGERRAGG